MKNILIVDDEIDIISSLEMVLTLEGYQVHAAYNGKAALNFLQNGTMPALIFSDLMMPVLDGYGLTRAVNENPETRDIPLILTSAAQLDETRLEPGSWDLFMRKPYDLDRLLEKITALLQPR